MSHDPGAIEAYKNEYRCNISPALDGTLRLDDVPPGKYVLSISFHSMVQGQESQELVSKTVDVVVPESPAVPTDDPLDLGHIEAGGEGL